MAGDPHMYETMFGAGAGYAYEDRAMAAGCPHSHFIIWLTVFALAGIAILGGLKVAGFHFVVKT